MFSYVCDSIINLAEVVKQRDCHSTTIYFYSVFIFSISMFTFFHLITSKPLLTFRLFFLLNIFSCMSAKKWGGHGRPCLATCDAPA